MVAACLQCAPCCELYPWVVTLSSSCHRREVRKCGFHKRHRVKGCQGARALVLWCALSALLDSPSPGNEKWGERYAERWWSPSLGWARASPQKQQLLETRETHGGKNITQLDVLCLGNDSEEQEKAVGAGREAFSAGVWGDEEAMRKGKVALCG